MALRHRLCGAPLSTQVRIIADLPARSPLRNEYITPPGCVTSTSGLDALRGVTAVGVEGVGVGLEAAGAGVQLLGSDGPSGTPFEQAAIVVAGKRIVTNRAKLRFMTCQG
jgi:hypothetical protein